MKKIFLSVCAIGLLLGVAGQALAQAPGSMPPGPPKVLQIFREEVKVGKGAAHEKFETGYVRAFAKAKWPTTYLAVTSTTGPSEAWFLTRYDSFEAWEKDQRATEKNAALQAELTQLGEKDAEFISGGRSIVLFYREELSYHAVVSIPEMRYFRIVTFRVRPGHDADFAEAVKTVSAAYDKTNLPVHWATFQVYAGMPSGTYLAFVPMKSLKEVDDALAHLKEFQAAEGEEGMKKLQKISSEAYQLVDSNIYAFSPKRSYVSKEFAAVDPDFWTPKPAAKPAAGAPAEKKEPKSPAAPAKKESAKKSSTKQ
jgi:hypothetical protein